MVLTLRHLRHRLRRDEISLHFQAEGNPRTYRFWLKLRLGPSKRALILKRNFASPSAAADPIRSAATGRY
jgi:hypothetical protein